MKNTKKFFKIFFSYKEEEKWLNQMSEKGYDLTDYSWGVYNFEKARSDKYIYRIGILKKSYKHEESKGFIKFMADCDIELVAANNRWTCFRRESSKGRFVLD